MGDLGVTIEIPEALETWPWIDRSKPVARLDELACPSMGLMDLLGRRWMVPVLHRLDLSGPIRPGALERSIPGLSRKELTRRLRELEALGWVRREVYAEVPPRVEYSLTGEGRSMLAPIRSLSEWAEAHGPSIASARSACLADD